MIRSAPEGGVRLAEGDQFLVIGEHIALPEVGAIPRESAARVGIGQAALEADLVAVENSRRTGVRHQEQGREVDARRIAARERDDACSVVAVEQV